MVRTGPQWRVLIVAMANAMHYGGLDPDNAAHDDRILAGVDTLARTGDWEAACHDAEVKP